MYLSAQIEITFGETADELVENIVGEGVTFSNAVINGIDIMHGTFSNGNSTSLGINSGVFLTTGNGTYIPGPNSLANTSTNCYQPGWPEINSTYDASILEFDFTPGYDTLKIEYAFGSEEYLEWVGSSYNDFFGIFISGPNPAGGVYNNQNMAVVPNSDPPIPVSINTVNNGLNNSGPCMNCEFYVDNANGLTLEYDGFTVALTAIITVVPCEEYHIKIGVADAGDENYDSGLFLKENSITSPYNGINVNCSIEGGGDFLVEGCVEADVIFSLPNASYSPLTVNLQVEGMAMEGVDYTPIGNSLTFEEGEDSVSIHIAAFLDGIIEEEEDIIIITQNELSCQTTYDTLMITIVDYQELVTETITEVPICEGQDIDITVISIGGLPPYSYDWSNGITDTTATITVSPNETTTYYCTVTDACGQSNVDSVTVTVLLTPIVDLGNDTSIMIGEELILDAGEGFLSYLWNDFSTGQTLTVTETGVYWVQVTNTEGCSASDIIEVDFYTGIDKTPSEQDLLQLFLNPASDIFTLQSDYDGIAKLFSQSGKLLSQKTISKNKKTNWDISNIESGVYFVSFISDKDKFFVVKKLIKK